MESLAYTHCYGNYYLMIILLVDVLYSMFLCHVGFIMSLAKIITTEEACKRVLLILEVV